MRLLNVYRLEFREFDSQSIPPYVIASHTWEPDGETTYTDFQEGRGTEKSGYQKVVGFAKYVKEHIPDIEWLWVDTCCIDQRHTQEVDKAVNSMFRWYLRAAVCLAYMQDVPSVGDITKLTGSRWFRRGWTLQELLASQAVVFLMQDWQVIGHKADTGYKRRRPSLEIGPLLNEPIARATGIPGAVLNDFRQSKSLSIGERLEWMDGRATKEPEDMSYSLMGIFDISMPTRYGEGEAKARRRLLAEVSKDDTVLGRLPVVRGAAFDDEENDAVSECLPETRTGLLQDIDEWASSNGSPCIFWLAGMAGMGKSTVFKTVAQRFRDQRRLAASFCFKRGEGDRARASRLITTVSAQLAQRLPDVRDAVISALEEDSNIIHKSLREQYQKLILRPLEHFRFAPVHGPAWIIGIDALDECDDESDIGVVIDLLARLKGLESANFRLLLTSRPDLPLRLGFGRLSSHTYHDIRLEEISEDIITHDIAVYLRHELAEIRSSRARLNGIDALGRDWPGEGVIQTLIRMAQPLFIFAATACRLLGEPDDDPQESLRIVLDHRLESAQLDRTYQPVLDRLILRKTDRQRAQIVDDFRIIVGAIIILAEPLPIPALSRLLEVSEEKINSRLQRLHSVLHVPSREEGYRPVRPLHLSFRDYLTDLDTREKTPFWIDEVQTHRTLANRCLRLLKRSDALRQDICGVEKPGIRRADVGSQRVEDLIPADIAYACRYWALHMVESAEQLCDNGEVHKFLQSHFLHWLEALGWLGRFSWAIGHLGDLRSLVNVHKGDRLSTFLDDARRFVLRNRYVIDLAPLQTYSSALMFTPKQSAVRRQFEQYSPKWLVSQSTVILDGSTETQKLEGYDVGITAVAFSPDGQTVASGSFDKTVRLWSVLTGENTDKLEGHNSVVAAVAFSPNGQTVASGSHDMTMLLWDARTGEKTHKLEGHESIVTAVAFSPDGQTVASGSEDCTMRLWNTHTGEETHKLDYHESIVTAVAFSPDGQTIASGLEDRTVRLWNAQTGEEMQKLEGHASMVTAVAFSPDGLTVASGSVDWTVRLWHARTGEETHKYNDHDSGVNAVAFSPDGQTVASGSEDRTVRLWNTRTGEETHKYKNHDSGVNAVAFSSDGQTVASGSEDRTVRLWNARTGEEEHKLEGYDRKLTAVAFSPDGQTVVSGSHDGTLRLWNVQTGEETHKLKGHEAGVTAVAFSPDGQTVASGSYDTTVRLWNAQTGKETQKLEGHDDFIRAVAISLDGLRVASGSYDRTTRLWNAQTGEETHKLEGHTNIVTAVAFSPDEQVLASGSYDKTVQLWKSWTGEPIYQFQDVGYVNRLTFDKHGPFLRTNLGILDLPVFTSSSQSTPVLPDTCLVVRDPWIQAQGEDVIWLPYDYRARSSAVHGNTLVVGQARGAVSFYCIESRD